MQLAFERAAIRFVTGGRRKKERRQFFRVKGRSGSVLAVAIFSLHAFLHRMTRKCRSTERWCGSSKYGRKNGRLSTLEIKTNKYHNFFIRSCSILIHPLCGGAFVEFAKSNATTTTSALNERSPLPDSSFASLMLAWRSA